jgi:integrase
VKNGLVTRFGNPLNADMPKMQHGNARIEQTLLKVGECLYRNQSSGTYYALVKRGGKQIKRSLKTTDRKLAERRLSDFRKESGQARAGKEECRLTFAQIGKQWFTLQSSTLKPASARRITLCLKEASKRFGSMRVTEITKQMCREWAAGRAAEVHPSTYNKDVYLLKAVLEYAIERGILLDNPAKSVPRLKAVSKLVQIPSRADFDLLVAELDKGDSRKHEAANLVHLLAYSGMRLAEATNILWREVDFERGQFIVTGGAVGTKNHEIRIVPLFPMLCNFLIKLRDEKQPKPDDRIINSDSAKRAIASACKAAGLQKVTHHSLRHFFVSNAIEVGIDFKTIAAWIGHKDGGLLVAKTYGHLRDTHSSAMAQRMVF